MKHTPQVLLLLAISVLLAACQPAIRKNKNITVSEIHDHIAYLAADEQGGRYPGEEGNIRSAEYIHKQLSDYGLTPMFDKGYQTFNVITGCELTGENHLYINDSTLEVNKQFIPLGFSGTAQAQGTVSFVAYGFEIDADSLKWNDYKAIDVTGQWTMILRDDPEPDNMMSEFISYAKDRLKVTLAKDKGAIGVLLVNGVNSSRKDIPKELGYDQNNSNAGIPVISITRATANLILAQKNKTIEELEKQIIENKTPINFTTTTQVDAQASIHKTEVKARNVVFRIKAKGVKKSSSTLFLGAHYDHLGMGGENTGSRMPDTIAVHNGADDNASGVAGIIELAGKLQSMADTLMHDIVVVAFDAEEMGTLGSKFLTQNMPEDIDSVLAMVNIDMIGRMKSDTMGITIGGTGTATEFDSILQIDPTTFTSHYSPDGYGPSDHAPFYSNDIPVLFFTTGAHEDYHTPLDDIEKLDLDSEKEILDYIAKVTLHLASNNDGLHFTSTGAANKGVRRTRLKVTLGIIPDVSGIVKDGLGIDGVRNGGPAQKGGIVKGDVITAINGKTVGNIYEYMFRLSKLKAETTAIVEIKRNDETQVLLIHL